MNKAEDIVIKSDEICILCNKKYNVTLTHKSFKYCEKCKGFIETVNAQDSKHIGKTGRGNND